MSEETMKTIPNKGTRLQGAKYLAIFSVVAWLCSIMLVKSQWLSIQDPKTLIWSIDYTMLWTTENMKWGLMSAFGIYASSETVVKAAEAYLNK